MTKIKKLLSLTLACVLAIVSILNVNPAYARQVEGADDLDSNSSSMMTLDKFMYVSALYSCLSESGKVELHGDDNPALEVGESISKIFDSSAKTYIGSYQSDANGEYLGDTNGEIECGEVLLKAGVTGNKVNKITADTLNGFLKGVYELNANSEHSLTCSYNVYTKTAVGGGGDVEGLNSKTMYWPQGYQQNPQYIKDENPESRFFDGTNMPKATITVAEDGSYTLTNYNGRINTDVLGGIIENYAEGIVSGSSEVATEACKAIIEGVEVEYPSGNYGYILATDVPSDNAGRIKWDTVKGNISSSSTGKQLKFVAPDERAGATTLANNLSEMMLNGNTPQRYLANDRSLEYWFYGRYLFGGDGFTGGCNGQTIQVNVGTEGYDKAIEEDPDWSLDSGYSFKVSAYKPGATAKEDNYITMIKPDPMATINPFPWDKTMAVPCYGAAGTMNVYYRFNTGATNDVMAKRQVHKYMNPEIIEDDGTVKPPDPTTPTTPPGTTEDTGSTPCYDNAGALGWIMCPAITALSSMAGALYDKIQEFLSIDSVSFFDTSSNNSTFGPWSVIRDIANVIMVIFLLVIILSQVTGVGIDNYGIKRMLPRLIIAAVLINLSFFICQLAVDLSNILGYSLNNMLSSGFGGVVIGSGSSATLGSNLLIGLGEGAAIGGAIVGITFLAGPGLIISILLFILTMAIAILFMFLILLVRQIAVVLLVVIAPLAFAAYLLPNTEKWFKKWGSAFMTMLMVFPICGLLVGGGQLVGMILSGIGATNEAFGIAAMLVQVIPYFFLPTILKSAMSALGNLGATVSGLQGRLTGAASKGAGNLMRNNPITKTWQQGVDAARASRLNRYQQWRAKRTIDRLGGRESLSNMQKRQLDRAKNMARSAKAAEDATTRGARDYDRFNAEVTDASGATRNFGDVLNEEALFSQSVADQEKVYSMNSALYNDNAALGKELESLLGTTEAEDPNVKAKIAAMENIMGGKGKEGRAQMKQAIKNAAKSGNLQASNLQSLSEAMMNGRHVGTYKDKTRSLYEMAKLNSSATKGSDGRTDAERNLSAFNSSMKAGGSDDFISSKYGAPKVDKFTQQDLASMDAGELDDYISYINNLNKSGSISDKDRKMMEDFNELANNTLNNERMKAMLDDEHINKLDTIARSTGRRIGTDGGGSTRSSSTTYGSSPNWEA